MHTEELKYTLSHMSAQQINGLDRMYNHVFKYKTDGFFVELGVGECKGKASNTADLADLGWQGDIVWLGESDVYEDKGQGPKSFTIPLCWKLSR